MPDTTKVIGWGKCSVKEGSNSAWEDIVEGSTSLEVEEGEELEALIEGGEAEARKKKPDKYVLNFRRRIGTASEASPGFTPSVTGNVVLEPEEIGAIGVTLTGCSKKVTVAFDSTDGLVAVYQYKTKGTSGDISFAAKAAAGSGTP